MVFVTEDICNNGDIHGRELSEFDWVIDPIQPEDTRDMSSISARYLTADRDGWYRRKSYAKESFDVICSTANEYEYPPPRGCIYRKKGDMLLTGDKSYLRPEPVMSCMVNDDIREDYVRVLYTGTYTPPQFDDEIVESEVKELYIDVKVKAGTTASNILDKFDVDLSTAVTAGRHHVSLSGFNLSFADRQFYNRVETFMDTYFVEDGFPSEHYKDITRLKEVTNQTIDTSPVVDIYGNKPDATPDYMMQCMKAGGAIDMDVINIQPVQQTVASSPWDCFPYPEESAACVERKAKYLEGLENCDPEFVSDAATCQFNKDRNDRKARREKEKRDIEDRMRQDAAATAARHWRFTGSVLATNWVKDEGEYTSAGTEDLVFAYGPLESDTYQKWDGVFAKFKFGQADDFSMERYVEVAKSLKALQSRLEDLELRFAYGEDVGSEKNTVKGELDALQPEYDDLYAKWYKTTQEIEDVNASGWNGGNHIASLKTCLKHCAVLDDCIGVRINKDRTRCNGLAGKITGYLGESGTRLPTGMRIYPGNWQGGGDSYDYFDKRPKDCGDDPKCEGDKFLYITEEHNIKNKSYAKFPLESLDKPLLAQVEDADKERKVIRDADELKAAQKELDERAALPEAVQNRCGTTDGSNGRCPGATCCSVNGYCSGQRGVQDGTYCKNRLDVPEGVSDYLDAFEFDTTRNVVNAPYIHPWLSTLAVVRDARVGTVEWGGTRSGKYDGLGTAWDSELAQKKEQQLQEDINYCLDERAANRCKTEERCMNLKNADDEFVCPQKPVIDDLDSLRSWGSMSDVGSWYEGVNNNKHVKLQKLQGYPMIVDETKSGWKSTDYNVPSGKTNSQAYDHCLGKSKVWPLSPGFSMWREASTTSNFAVDHDFKCRVYTSSNEEPEYDDVCVHSPWTDRGKCMKEPNNVFAHDVDGTDNSWAAGGLYWRRKTVGDLQNEDSIGVSQPKPGKLNEPGFIMHRDDKTCVRRMRLRRVDGPEVCTTPRSLKRNRDGSLVFPYEFVPARGCFKNNGWGNTAYLKCSDGTLDFGTKNPGTSSAADTSRWVDATVGPGTCPNTIRGDVKFNVEVLDDCITDGEYGGTQYFYRSD